MPKQEQYESAFQVVPRTIGELWEELGTPDTHKVETARVCWAVTDQLKTIYEEECKR